MRDMTDNEMAKLHVRYMVGGQPRGLERRAAVPLRVSRTAGRAAQISAGDRLAAGTSACSITATTARTTAACSPESRCRRQRITDFLLHSNELQYAYTEETDNPAYKIFLGR